MRVWIALEGMAVGNTAESKCEKDEEGGSETSQWWSQGHRKEGLKKVWRNGGRRLGAQHPCRERAKGERK